MWSVKLSVIACFLSLGSSQDILFRSSLPGRVSHHTRTVTDGVSTVHRHHTQANNPSTRVQLVQTPVVEPVSRQQEPVLLQHADGRFFALNANLEPGQFFQTSDGRIFTLRAGANQPTRNRNSGTGAQVTRDRTVDTTTTESPETTTEAVTTTTIATPSSPEPVTEMPMLEDSNEASGRRTNEDDSNTQVAASIIATAPLTPSTARFVGASTPQHFNTFHSIENNLVHAAFPISRGNVQFNQHVAPVFRSSVPVLRLQNNAGHTQEEIIADDQGNHALVRTHSHTAPSSAVALRSNPNAAAFILRRNPFASSLSLSSPAFSSSSPAFTRFEAVPSSETSEDVATSVSQANTSPLVQVANDAPAAIAARITPQAAVTARGTPQAAIATRGHQLADSATSVFQGFYSFPSVGIDFDF